MNRYQRLLMSGAIFFLVSLFVFILFSEQGYMELHLLKKKRDALVAENERLARENVLFSAEIDRLENDARYIESIARKDLGMVAEDEFILQPKTASKK